MRSTGIFQHNDCSALSFLSSFFTTDRPMSFERFAGVASGVEFLKATTSVK